MRKTPGDDEDDDVEKDENRKENRLQVSEIDNRPEADRY